MLRSSTTRLLLTFFCLLLLLGHAAGSPARRSGITVEDYCRLTRALMEVSVREWEERANLAASHKGDRKKQAIKLEKVAKRYQSWREKIYSRYGLSLGEDLRYAVKHRSEIESYLEEQPEVQDLIKALKERIDTLIQQVESAAPTPSEGARK